MNPRDKPFCRYCLHILPESDKAEECPACKKSSVPLTEEAITVTPESAKGRLDVKEAVLVDVRWPPERQLAMIEEDTIYIPLHELEHRMEELPQDTELIVYCHHGGRSRYATIMLLCNGFDKVRNLKGGIDAWSREVDENVPLY